MSGFLARRLGMDRIRPQTILSSTRQVEALDPAVVATHPPLAGPPLGVDLETGNAVACDPHALYTAGRITSPVVAVVGDVGTAKSSLVKTVYVKRKIAIGGQVAVFDRKNQQGSGEYDRVSELVGGTRVVFNRTGGAAINILDPRIARHSGQDAEEVSEDAGGRVGQDQLLELAATYAHGPLAARERYALRAAHEAAVSDAVAAGKVATIHDVIEHLKDPQVVPSPRLEESGLVTSDDVAMWGLDLALDLDRFVSGDLSGLIDAETTEGIDWDAALLVFDTSALAEGSPALALVMATIATFLSDVWSAKPGRERVIVVEEGYHTVDLPGEISVAKVLRSLVKRGRGIGLAFVTVIHHISDLPEGSDAISLIREAQVVHVFRQSRSDDAALAAKWFRFPAWTAELLPELEQGTHLLKIGKEPGREVRHLRSGIERWMTDTDAGMSGRDGDAA